MPLLAPAGVAYVYGPGIDPDWELSRSMAVSDRMVLLVRALAVFGLNAAVCALAPRTSYLAFAACCCVVVLYATRIPKGTS